MPDSRVELRINRLLEADFDQHKTLLPGYEISRQHEGDHVVLTWLAPDAPPGATAMTPWFTHDGSSVELTSIDYYDATGTRL
ncbi:hypothetical protein ACIQXD_05115 [Streptomyces uncialis]|uniref:hypothetical protein n=1 Tax=Streptomyces uncialis TaxID=1048205 RepID=UPI003829DA62